MKLSYHPFKLALKHKFKIAHDERTHQETLIVEISQNGLSGFGEATASKYYHNSIEDMIRLLEINRELIESYDLSEPSLFWNSLHKKFSKNHFVLSALDIAIHDVYAKCNKISLSEFWKLESKPSAPDSNYTIGIDSIDTMVMKLKEFPWPRYKIKLGTNEDIAIVKELRKHTDAVFRVDANCGWGVDETLSNCLELKKLNVEFVEQPLPADDWEGMKYLYDKSVLPLMADESCIKEEDVMKCVGHFHAINIKLMKCGGYTPALRMIKTARDNNLKTMVGCMTESSIGIAGIGQLVSLLDYVDMDGFLLLAEDTAKGPWVKNQAIQLPDGYGIGIDSLIK
jgi:L-alanine-DL-glutamate epimerase-like enolase superfamily enzyme